MNVSSRTSIGSQYASAASTQKVQHSHAPRGGGKTQDTVELSAEAKEKYEQSKGNLSSDFDPATELSAADQKELLSKMKEDFSNTKVLDPGMPASLQKAIATVKDNLSAVDLETASAQDISRLLTKVHAALEASKPPSATDGGKPVNGPPHGGTPSGGHPPGGPAPNGGAQGKSSVSSDDSKTIQSLLDALTDQGDTNGDGVVDERDEQIASSKSATELKSKLTEWLAGDKTTTAGSYDSLVKQLSSLNSSQDESAS